MPDGKHSTCSRGGVRPGQSILALSFYSIICPVATLYCDTKPAYNSSRPLIKASHSSHK